MTTSVIINDFVCDRRVVLCFSYAEFQPILQIWHTKQDLFPGDDASWATLETTHFRHMIAQNLDCVADLTEAEQTNENNIAVKGLYFLLMGLVCCIEGRTQSMVELLTINRIAKQTIAVSFSATLNDIIDDREPEAKVAKPNPLHVVVDNTKP